MTKAGTILYADDSDDDVFLMQQAFTKINGNRLLKTVQDGQEAIAYLSGSGKYADRATNPQPQVMLLDIKMPRMNGFEVLEWVRQKSSFCHLPVVMFSASLEEKDRNRAYELGANSFLVKPTGLDELISIIGVLEKYWLHINTPVAHHL